MEHPYEHLIGKRFLAHGKFAWRGKLREVVGVHLVVDECEMLFRADAETVETTGSAKPVDCGDGVVIHTDWLESVIPEENCAWAKKPSRRVTS